MDEYGRTTNELIREIVDAFDEFKSRNDAKITEIEKKIGRPNFEVQTGTFGEAEKAEFREILQGKSMDSLTGADGGYLVPSAIHAHIESMVLAQSPIRQVANVIQIETPRTSLPVNTRGTTGGWAGDGDARNESNTPALEEVVLNGGTIYALPKVSEELVEDALVNIEQFLSENVVDTLAEMESQAFIDGDGVKKPDGFLNADATDETDAVREFGKLQFIYSGDEEGLGDDLQSTLLKMVFALRAGYRQAGGCAWLMGTDVISQIAGLTDEQNRPLYVPSLSEEIPATLLGYRVVECEHMPAVEADAFPIAFGNWKRGYTIADRSPLTVLRDPYSEKGQVSWYFRRRVHGGVVNSNAIKLLKIAVPEGEGESEG